MNNNRLVIREAQASFDGPQGTTLECPHCHGAIDVSVPGMRWTVRSPRDIAERLRVQMAGLEREELRVVLLNTKNIVIEVVTVYVGNVAGNTVRVGELFTEAVRRNATSIALVHNHPSGDPTPSPDDLHLSAEALAAGRLLDIQLLDHIVVAGDAWTSLRERGVAFDRR